MAATNPFKVSDLVSKYGWQIMVYLSNLGATVLAESAVLFVDSGATNALDSDDGEHGHSFDKPFATANFAMNMCTASQGDIVLLAPGHAETLDDLGTASSDENTDELVMDKIGVSLIGIGSGTLRPTFTCGSADTTAGINITAANCRVKNIRVISGLADLAAGITIGASADGTIIEDCDIRDGNSAILEMVIGILVAANADDVVIRNCNFSTVPSGGCANAIKLAGGSDRCIIEGNVAQGTYSAGTVLGSAAKSTEMIIKNNIFTNQGAVALALKTDCTGIISGNFLAGTTSMAAALTGDNAMWCFENYITGAVAVSGVINPAVDSE